REDGSGGGGAKTDAGGGGGAKTEGGGGGANTDGGGVAAFTRGGAPGAGSSTAALNPGETIVRSARRGGGTGGAAVREGTGPGACSREGGSGITPVVADWAVGGRSGTRGVRCGSPAAGESGGAPRPSPGNGTAPSRRRTPATDGACTGAAASGGRRGISVWQVLHLSLAPPGGMRRSSMLYAVWQDGHVTRMGSGPEASRLPRAVRGRRTLRA